MSMNSISISELNDLVFVRSTPDAVQRQIDSKKKGSEIMSQRLLPYADPKLYRISKVTDFGLFHLDDPATGQPAIGYREAISADRLIRYEDLPPQEQPLNPNEEIWIEIKPNEGSRSDTWLTRKIESQCDTGEVRICAADGSDSRIVDLTKYSYHFVKPPSSVTASTVPDRVDQKVEAESDSSEDHDAIDRICFEDPEI